MRAFHLLGALTLIGTLTLLSATSDAGGKKKIDVTGVITQVHRDNNPKDMDIGYIMVDAKKGPVVEITVMKGTDITHNGKNVGFKALDKGDHVSIDTKPGHPHVADKIHIRKN